jgi:STE24 endopeptidase
MTATRIVRGATLVAAGALGVYLASLLWRTTVPAGLSLPHVDEGRAFGGELVRRARYFERVLDWLWVAGTVAVLSAYFVVVRRAGALAARLGLRPVNAGIVLGMLTFTAAWAATLPFVILGNWWERRHGISREGYGAVVLGAWIGLLVTTAIAFIVLAIVLLLARRLGRAWWVAAAPVSAVILLVIQFVSPYLATIGTHPVRSASLRADIRALERREHAGRPLVRVDDVSSRTAAANAFSVGIGPSARVIVWSTLLGGRFTRSEVRFVIGHELGHVVRRHVLRGVAWFALLIFPVLALTALLADIRRPAAVPLALLVLAVVQLALLPLRNAISRRYEAEADWIGLNGARAPAAAQGAFVGFVRTSLQDPSPPGWVHVFLDDHPTPLQRVEMARAWALRVRR